MQHKKELSDDLKLVRTELKEVLADVKTQKTSLKKANTILSCDPKDMT